MTGCILTYISTGRNKAKTLAIFYGNLNESSHIIPLGIHVFSLGNKIILHRIEFLSLYINI